MVFRCIKIERKVNKMNDENEKLEILKEFKERNINIIPLNENSKTPAIRWTLYQNDKFNFDSLVKHYQKNNYAAICGSISNNLIVFDFDLAKEWKENGNSLNSDNIYQRYQNIVNITQEINTLIIKTPSGGLHIYFLIDDMEIYQNLETNKDLVCSVDGFDHLDIQGEGKYVVIPPSEINGKKYEIYNNGPIQKISNDFFQKLINTWSNISNEKKTNLETLSQLNNVRQCFIDIIEGKIDIEKYAKKHKKDKFLIISALFREYYHNADIEPKKLFDKLEKNQPCFNRRETEKQLKYHSYTDNPYTNEKLSDLFPDYHFSTINETERSLLYQEFYNKTRQEAIYLKNGINFETKNFKNWLKIRKAKKIEKTLNNENSDINKLIKQLTSETTENTIIAILEKIDNFEQESLDKLLMLIQEKTKKERSWLEEQIEIIYVEQLAKEQHIKLSLRTLMRDEIIQLASNLDLNRPGSITGFFLAIKKNCNLNRESICLTLLPNIEELMNKIIQEYPMFIIEKTNDFYLYDSKGVYEKQNKTIEDIISELIVKEIPFYVKQIVGDVYFSRRVKTIAKEIEIRSYVKEEDLNFDIINVKNGILKLEDIKMKKWILWPHSPQYLSIFQLNVKFNPFIVCKKKIIIKNLKERLNEQLIYLIKLFGIALLGTPYIFKVFLVLVGPSGTSKSEFILKILEHLVGMQYVSQANLHALCSEKENFESGLLSNTLVNISGDIAGKPLEDSSYINRLTEKYINVNKKYGFKGTIINRVSHFYACNRMPIIAETDRKDIMRRFFVIDVRGEPIPENKQDPDFFKNLIHKYPEEIPYFFNGILSELSTILIKRKLKLPSINERREKYFRFACPLNSFINSYIIKYPTNKSTKPNDTYLITRDYFLEIYNKYRNKLNYEQYETTHKLTAENNTLTPDLKLYIKRKNNNRVYIGIKFNEKAIKEFNIKIEKIIEQEKIYFPEKKEDKSEKIEEQKKIIDTNFSEDKIEEIISKIREIFETNKNIPLDENNIIEVLNIDYSEKIIKAAFDEAKKRKLFSYTENQLFFLK